MLGKVGGSGGKKERGLWVRDVNLSVFQGVVEGGRREKARMMC